jgi:hypothetical protein
VTAHRRARTRDGADEEQHERRTARPRTEGRSRAGEHVADADERSRRRADDGEQHHV